jgi:Zn-finger in ubiquitin-hydrolases and other protein
VGRLYLPPTAAGNDAAGNYAGHMTMPVYAVAGDADGNPANATCSHLSTIADVTPSSTRGCEDCLAEGSHWVHLRECLQCGKVACCDDSPRKHATAHFHASSHPIVRSIEPHEEWAWCYPDSLFLLPA